MRRSCREARTPCGGVVQCHWEAGPAELPCKVATDFRGLLELTIIGLLNAIFQRTGHWRKVGDGAQTYRFYAAKPLKSLARSLGTRTPVFAVRGRAPTLLIELGGTHSGGQVRWSATSGGRYSELGAAGRRTRSTNRCEAARAALSELERGAMCASLEWILQRQAQARAVERESQREPAPTPSSGPRSRSFARSGPL
jgi:hypothetical protein